jgi:hypothetical protein
MKFFKKNDFFIILFILIAGIGIWFFNSRAQSSSDLIAVISHNNEEIMRIDLSTAQNTTFSLEQDPEIVFEIKDGSIGFIHSDCPDQLCVAAGFLNKSGESAVGLPNKVGLLLISSGESDDTQPDAIVR